MRQSLTYLDFEIMLKLSTVERSKRETQEEKENVYQITISKSPVAATGAVVQLPKADIDMKLIGYINEKLLELRQDYEQNLTLSNAALYQAERTALAERLQILGDRLAEVLPLEVWQAFEKAYKFAQSRRCGIKLGLDLTEAPQLYGLPWELLFYRQRGSHLSLSTYTPIVRVVRTPVQLPDASPNFSNPLKMLLVVVASQPEDATYTQAEAAAIQQALKSDKRLLTLDCLEGVVTLRRFQRQLQQEAYDIIHFIGHGTWDNSRNVASIIFHADTASDCLELPIEKIVTLPKEYVEVGDLKLILSEMPNLKLLFFNSCQSGSVNLQDELDFGNIVTGLTKNGVASVIALQEKVTQVAAKTFATEFYTQLMDGSSLEEAIVESRKLLFIESRNNSKLLGQWFLPVWYEARNPEPEPQPWYVMASEKMSFTLKHLSSERNFMGTIYILALSLISVVLLQPLLNQLIPSDPHWQFALNHPLDLQAFEAYKWLGDSYVTQVFAPLTICTDLVIFAIAYWVHLDLQLDPAIGKLTKKRDKIYFFTVSYIGATLGFITGIVVSYIFISPIFYYLGVADHWPDFAKTAVEVIAVLPCTLLALVYSRQIALSGKLTNPAIKKWTKGKITTETSLKLWDGETFIAAACPFLPFLFYILLIVVCGTLLFIRPWGYVFCLGVWGFFSLWESRKAIKKA